MPFLLIIFLLAASFFTNFGAASAAETNEVIMRLMWDIVPQAVKYKISYAGGEEVSYTNGIEVEVVSESTVFKVDALDYGGNVIAEDVLIKSVETNPTSPRTMTEFDKMAYPPLYLVYSWIPSKYADHYEIQLLKGDEVVREITTKFYRGYTNFDFYDDTPLTEEGEYFWRLRGVSANGNALTDWSEKMPGNSFKVETPARFCALGDSITHGGGAISVPPSVALYNWETYCRFPVKNLGCSGDTTKMMVERFESDVLPFRPEVLFILAGVNDYRGDTFGWSSMQNLKKIKSKCEANGIKPVFITPTPINAALIRKIKFVENPPSDWQVHRKFICDWIRKQEFHIDIEKNLSDEKGDLILDFSTDGLHPDIEGKKIIGAAVENWIENYLKARGE